MRWLASSSAGFGGTRPDDSRNRFALRVALTCDTRLESLVNSAESPTVLAFSLSSMKKLGLRMSASISSTVRSSRAKFCAIA